MRKVDYFNRMMSLFHFRKHDYRTWACMVIIIAHVSFLIPYADGQGLPFLKNYTANDYHAHSRNFDIEVGEHGFIYVANFEGLIYFDGARWHTIHTPGITRVTVVKRDKNNTIWAGGYNYFGKIIKKANGDVCLQRVGDDKLFRGEVLEIMGKGDELCFAVNNGYVYKVEDDKVSVKAKTNSEAYSLGLSDVINTEELEQGNQMVVLEDVTQEIPVGNGQKIIVKRGCGLTVADDNGNELYTITEENGLCSNNVVWVVNDNRGLIWGATDDGVFSIALPSAYSRFTKNEGLTGEVMAIGDFNGRRYVGTNHGLFRQVGMSFVKTGVDHACWSIVNIPQGLLAATANGIYRIMADGSIRQQTTSSTTTLMVDDNLLYSGEMDGLYLTNLTDNSRKKICDFEKISKVFKDSQGTIWIQNMYGQVWSKKVSEDHFKPSGSDKEGETVATLVQTEGQVYTVSVETTEPFPYPQFSYYDNSGVTWLTNNEGKGLYRWKGGKKQDEYEQLVYPLKNVVIRSMYIHKDEIWFGHDNGFTLINVNVKDPALETTPRLLVRNIILGSDSILWGGYGKAPEALPIIGTEYRNITFTFSLDHEPIFAPTLYRYQLDDGGWSAWNTDHDAEFVNLPYGSYTFKVQAQDAFGRLSDITAISFRISYPFYMRWYMLIIYLLLIGLLFYLIIQLRLRRLERDKMMLEKVVQERTAEVVQQKDEIEEKSRSLEKALDELGQAQHELIRQEKMATVGKLTQGLIDRILNPLNYINNFAKLSEGLLKDVEANIEDEKEKMDEENYEDTKDVLDMLKGNLQKVGEHGQNTTRTLKAMEEMLKDRSVTLVKMDLAKLLRQNQKMVETYYAKEIASDGIKVSFELPEEELSINGNAEQLSKTIMSLLANAIYAVVKKAQREKYQPEVSVAVRTTDNNIQLTIHDNGIGIEDTILNKIFDPFFTTKTTGEASGVGLYLSREIIQNHGGDISVASVKNEYSEFTITLPTIKA